MSFGKRDTNFKMLQSGSIGNSKECIPYVNSETQLSEFQELQKDIKKNGKENHRALSPTVYKTEETDHSRERKKKVFGDYKSSFAKKNAEREKSKSRGKSDTSRENKEIQNLRINRNKIKEVNEFKIIPSLDSNKDSIVTSDKIRNNSKRSSKGANKVKALHVEISKQKQSKLSQFLQPSVECRNKKNDLTTLTNVTDQIKNEGIKDYTQHQSK